MDVRVIETDRYCVVISWRGNVETGLTLDDSIFSLVDRCFDPNEQVFYFFCFRCKSEECNCCTAVKQFRKDAFLDSKD